MPATLPSSITADKQSGVSWLWLALGAVAAALAGGAALLRLRRRPQEPAPIEPPLARSSAQALAATGADALAMTVEAIQLSRSFLYATVDYRVTLRNRLDRALQQVAVEADLTSASNDRPVDQQLAAAGTALEPRHAAARLMPGQSIRFEGKLQLPLAQVSVVRQSGISLLVPLLRLRATADGLAPLARTYVIGQGGAGAARPQPFRLDEPPRSYAPLAQRALDQATIKA